jgi:hypothetical protein
MSFKGGFQGEGTSLSLQHCRAGAPTNSRAVSLLVLCKCDIGAHPMDKNLPPGLQTPCHSPMMVFVRFK